MEDIFEFWSHMEAAETIHPADRKVLSDAEVHRFDLGCLPGCFMGPLKTAPIVLLYLSPGFSEEDKKEASCDDGQYRQVRNRRGLEPLPNETQHSAAWKWWKSRTGWIGDPKAIQDKIAILDICAYHSTSFRDWHMLSALPSSRVCLDWAQRELFPAAERGERLVVCLRSPKYWGLRCGMQYGDALYAPNTTRRGYMRAGVMRERIVEAAQKFLTAPV